MILWFNKIILHNKIINNQENSVQDFGETYLTNYLAKYMQD